MENNFMRFLYDEKRGGIISLTSALDAFQTEFVLTPEEFPEYDVEDGKWLGSVEGQCSVEGKDYDFLSGDIQRNSSCLIGQDRVVVECPEIRHEGTDLGLSLKMEFAFEEEALSWKIALQNKSKRVIYLTDLNIPLLMNQYFRYDDTYKYDRCVMRHTCITGHSSYLYWEKSSGNKPILLMMPDQESVFMDLTKEKDGSLFGGRFQENSGYEGLVRVHLIAERPVFSGQKNRVQNSVLLKPEAVKEFRIFFEFLENEKQIDETLAKHSLTVLKAVPGMVGPAGNDFHVMTRPADAEVILCSREDRLLDTTMKNGWRVSRIRFGGYGKRYVKVNNRGNLAYYCFFATEALQEMIDRHAAFIAGHQLELDESDPCFHGLLMWDMGNKRRINSSFNPYAEDWWRGGSDDPGLASGLFLSEKNVYRPVESELLALRDFVEDFLIDRLTEQPGWRVHRMVPWYTMFEPWAGNGADDVWRAYNYVHVINIMRNMYLIQKRYQVSFLREACEYLKMAYKYTIAMFYYWMYPRGVGAREFGNMGEMTLPLFLAGELQKEGFEKEAEIINRIMDDKACYFASKEYPFGSEMPYDSTAFEAVYAYGKRIGSEHIMESAARVAFANRGKQPVWFLYHTDLRAGGDTSWNSSYMTQLGAWPILDYCLEEGHITEDWILSFYGSYLSGWLLYNSGGYWNSDPENRGATGWITIASRINDSDLEPAHVSESGQKAGMPLSKGCVTLSGEAGIGYFGALRCACSIVMEHSVLGRIGLGCDIRQEGDTELVFPADGLSVRLYHVPERWKLELDGGFLRQVRIAPNFVEAEIVLQAKTGTCFKVMGIPEAGKEQKLLYQQDLIGIPGESRLIHMERAIWERSGPDYK